MTAPRIAHAGFVEGLDLVGVTPFVGGQVVRAFGGMPASMSGSTFANGSAHFDAGYAFLIEGDKTIQGYGAKIGLTIDYFPHKLISFGGGGDFDLQAFPVDGQPLIGVGGTFVARIGLHL